MINDATGLATSAESDQTARTVSSSDSALVRLISSCLIGVCTVCSDLSVPIFRILWYYCTDNFLQILSQPSYEIFSQPFCKF